MTLKLSFRWLILSLLVGTGKSTSGQMTKKKKLTRARSYHKMIRKAMKTISCLQFIAEKEH